ncbi:hypothetical protein AXG93_4368s2490 [Marchantia polymorpha subsp. ruderalis]|uniref:Uncharacterized protein n=1 Tax=Marchantia polymorpha subsp. ruderalis TaxID=1480154 RepID=A0A176VYA6_MARPO|nr:hypothetical protein AXG93_4368s2490 [Marchantia polymorpha subsp. ruderalis]
MAGENVLRRREGSAHLVPGAVVQLMRVCSPGRPRAVVTTAGLEGWAGFGGRRIGSPGAAAGGRRRFKESRENWELGQSHLVCSSFAANFGFALVWSGSSDLQTYTGTVKRVGHTLLKIICALQRECVMEKERRAMYTQVDSGRGLEEDSIQVVSSGEEQIPPAVLRSIDDADDEEVASTSSSTSDRAIREAEGIPLIQIRTYGDRVVGSLGALVYYFYGGELRELFGYDDHPYGFYALVVVVALLVGLLYGFFIAIICGQNISNRHYHILAKQELTKEYVVEHLSENEEPPQLDPGHLNELKMLGLF